MLVFIGLHYLLYPVFGLYVNLFYFPLILINAIVIGRYGGLLTGFLGYLLIIFLEFTYFGYSPGEIFIVGRIFNYLLISFVGFIIGYFRDIYLKLHHEMRVKKQFEQKIMEINQELSQLTYILAHDLRNFLSNIKGYADFLKQEYREEHVEEIGKNVQYINDLLSQSIKLAEAGQIIQKTEIVDLNSVLHKVKDILQIPSHVKVEMANLPTIKADSQKTYQVFKNIIENAILHGSPSQIKIILNSRNSHYFIQIVNDGIPFPNDILHAFNNDPDKLKKYGLGLSIIKKITNAHGWDITLENSPQPLVNVKIPIENTLVFSKYKN